jgi:integrase
MGKASGTINIELDTLKRALRLAHENGKLAKVPAIRMLKPNTPRSGFFEPEQFKAVSAALPADLTLVALIGYTYGWRLCCEVLTLTRRQVDLDTGTLRLEPGSTKNGEGRIVYLIAELRASIAEQLARVKAMERQTGRITPWLFPHLRANYRGQRRKNFVTTWQRACQRAGCEGMLRHDLRRTAVRNMVNAGVSERMAMKVMGHRTISVFHRYHIVSPSDLQDVALKRLPYNLKHIVLEFGPAVSVLKPVRGQGREFRGRAADCKRHVLEILRRPSEESVIYI